MVAGASDRVFDIVDPDLFLDHVDINALLDRVDINALLDRVDVDALLDRVDIDTLMERVDVDALMERVDVQSIVDRAGIPEIVAESTAHLTGSALDMFRRPVVGLDEVVFRAANRLVGRDPNELPQGPGDVMTWVDAHIDEEEEKGPIKTGRYAGPLTRLLAVVLDALIVTVSFTLITAGIDFLIGLFVRGFELPAGRGLWYGIALITWAFVYMWFALAVFGKTAGKTILGVRVINQGGGVVLNGRQAFVRTLTYPLSYAILGIGLLGVVFGRERQAWHDHLARTVVVYDWGSRTAAMPTPLARYLERKGADI